MASKAFWRDTPKSQSSTLDYLSPSRLFFQIALLQTVYYVVAAIVCFISASVSGMNYSLDWVFSWVLVEPSTTIGWTLTVIWLFDSLVCVFFMMIVVGRSKLAWDFALTLQGINLIVVWVYSGQFPTSALWWVLQGISALILVSLGTWSSQWKELRETFFEGVDLEQGGPSQYSRSSRDADSQEAILLQNMDSSGNEVTPGSSNHPNVLTPVTTDTTTGK